MFQKDGVYNTATWGELCNYYGQRTISFSQVWKNTSSKKADIIKWIEVKGEIIDKPMVICELLKMVNRIKPMYDKYAIDELVKSHKRTILWLSLYNYELNPIEMAWSSVKHHVKINNTTFKFSWR